MKVASEAREEAKEELMDSLNDNFDANTGRKAEDYSLTWMQAEIFTLFQDINWNGLFDISDSSWEYVKAWWKMAWALVVWSLTILALPTTTGLVTIWATVWFAATLVSIALNPKWYSTFWEAFVDNLSNLWVWTVSWMAWWQLVKSFWVEWAKFLSIWWARNTSIFVWDIAILWIWWEMVRQSSINWIFEKDKI